MQPSNEKGLNGAWIGVEVGDSVGNEVGVEVEERFGTKVGWRVGVAVGDAVGSSSWRRRCCWFRRRKPSSLGARFLKDRTRT